MFSALSVVIAHKEVKLAFNPLASVEPSVPEPAMVVTTPLGVIFLMTLLSATYMLPDGPIQILVGERKLAAVPCPSTEAYVELPANVDTVPSGAILRIILFPKSEMNRLPLLSTTIPMGSKNVAAVPTPF